MAVWAAHLEQLNRRSGICNWCAGRVVVGQRPLSNVGRLANLDLQLGFGGGDVGLRCQLSLPLKASRKVVIESRVLRLVGIGREENISSQC